MALPATSVFEVQSGASNNNGGAYSSADGGTDHTYPTSSPTTFSATLSASATTTLTDSGAGFTSAMVDNFINITTGGGMSVGRYHIVSFTDSSNVVLDRTPGTGSAGTGTEGGAVGDPGEVSGLMTIELMSMHIKTGTYGIAAGTVNTAGNKLSFPDTELHISGYNTTRGDLDAQQGPTNKPILQASAGSLTVLNMQNNSANDANTVSSIYVDANGQTSVVGFNSASGNSNDCISCHAEDCSTGFKSVRTTSCETINCTTGFATGERTCDVARDGVTGFSQGNDTSISRCVAFGNSGDGFVIAARAKVSNCTADSNGSDGFSTTSTGCEFVNSVATNNTGYGWNPTAAGTHTFIHCAGYSNTSGHINGTPGRNIGFITITDGDPWENTAANDYRPNATASRGALLRAAGLGLQGQTDAQDIGAVQHADPAGGGGTVILTRPRRVM